MTHGEAVDTAVRIEAGFEEYMVSCLPPSVQQLYVELVAAVAEMNIGRGGYEAVDGTKLRDVLRKFRQLDITGLPEDLIGMAGLDDV